MEPHHCAGSIWTSDDVLTWFQFVSDLIIALSYFIIPLQLVYLGRKSPFAQYRMIFLLFEVFIILCGATHVINLWVLSCHTKTVDIVQAVAKVICAIFSCAAAIALSNLIRAFLTYKLVLSLNVSEPDSEKVLVKIQEGMDKTEY
jgi:ethylene receptor